MSIHNHYRLNPYLMIDREGLGSRRMGPIRLGSSQGVGLMGWVNTRPLVCGSPYGMAFGGQEEPFSRLALAV